MKLLRFSLLRTGLFRVMAVAMLLSVLLAAATLTGRAQPAGGTLTLQKITQPAGGANLPLTAVGYLHSVTTTLRSPRDLDRDNAGIIYVVSQQSHRLDRFAPDGTYIDSWGGRGDTDGMFFRPDDLAVYDNGTVTVYVADTENDRIQKFDANGELLGKWGRAGTGPGEFGKPQGLAVDADGYVYVTDTNNHRIQKFDANGKFLAQWGREGTAPGEYSYPSGIDIAPNGDIYIADSNNHRIQVLNSQGQFVRQWGRHGDAPGMLNLPGDLTLDDQGFVLVADTYNHRIQKYTMTGRYLARWGTQGAGPNQFERPNGIMVEPGGKTYVIDIDSDDIRVFHQTTVYLDHGQQQPLNLPEASYRVTEAPDGAWPLSGVDCDGGGAGSIEGGVDLTVQDGDSITCTFTNVGTVSQTGAVTGLVYHDIDLDRYYNTIDVPLANWPLWLLNAQGMQIGAQQQTAADGRVVFSNLAPGAYQLCTVLPDGWYNIYPGYNGPIPGTGDSLCSSVTVSSGVNTTARLGQVQEATLVVRKQTIPGNAAAAFPFNSPLAALSVQLRDGQTAQTSVYPGVYTVIEGISPSGFSLTSITCDDSDSEGKPATRTATFRAAPGEQVTCTFTSQGAPGSLGIFVYHDTDRSGAYADGDRALAGWTARVRTPDGVQIGADVLTGNNGRATLDSLPAGALKACVDVPAGWTNTEPGDGGASASREVCRNVVVASGTRTDAYFGNWSLNFKLYAPFTLR